MRAWLFLLLALPAQAADPLFPRPYEIFRPLLADPRQIQLGGYYYRLNGQNMGDAALGHSWGMARWNVREVDLQWNLEGMAYSRFQVSGDVNKFQAVDFEINVSAEARRGPLETKVFLYHVSSHLGDDYIRDTRDLGFRYSVEGLRFVTAVSPVKPLRLYGGAGYLIHRIPVQSPASLQLGWEGRTPDFKLGGYPALVYLGHDLQWRERVRWNMTSRATLGLRVTEPEGRRAGRIHVGYQQGHSAFGQFYLRRERQADVGITFEI